MESWEVVSASCRGLDDDKVELHCIAVLMLSSCARGRHGWFAQDSKHDEHATHTVTHPHPNHNHSVVW
jgi:hypothetical protein